MVVKRKTLQLALSNTGKARKVGWQRAVELLLKLGVKKEKSWIKS
jgi:hypothetical protein